MSPFNVLVIIISFFLWIDFLWKRRKLYIFMNKINGPRGLPIIGVAHKIVDKKEVLNNLAIFEEEYGSFVTGWVGPFPILLTIDPDVVKDVLTSPICINKGVMYSGVTLVTGNGLFSMDDPEWSVHRRLLNPAFGHKILLSFLPIFNQEANNILEMLAKNSGKGEMDIKNFLQLYALNVTTQTTMGKKLKMKTETETENLVECYQGCLKVMSEMALSPWLVLKPLRQLLGKNAEFLRSITPVKKFVQSLIAEKIADDKPLSEKKNENVFIDLAINLLRKGKFKPNHVEDEANVIVFGAFETTANSLSFILLMLAMFPEYQEKAFEEILSLFPKAGNFEVTYDDIKQMVYMDMIISETMRFMAPVPLVIRTPSEDVKLSNGIVVPKGVQIIMDLFHMHRRKDIWGPEADKFNPDNFLPSNLYGKHPYAYIPFTKGKRNCIGWRYSLISLKTFLAKTIRNYRLTTSFRSEDLQFVEDITIKVQKTPLFEFHKRD